MYGVNNVNHSPFNLGKNGQHGVQNGHKGADQQNAVRKDEILFSSVSRKDESYLSSLSKEAKDYLNKLKEMYPDYDFIIADYKTDEEASEILSQGKGEMNVLITPDLLEKMATDEATRAKYEDVIAGAKDQFKEINENLTENGKSIVKALGITVNADGTVSFYANLKDNIGFEGKNTIKSSLISDFTKALNAFGEGVAKLREQMKAQKDNKPPHDAKPPHDDKPHHGGKTTNYSANPPAGKPGHGGTKWVPFIDATGDKPFLMNPPHGHHDHGHGVPDTKVHSNSDEHTDWIGKSQLDMPKNLNEILEHLKDTVKLIRHGNSYHSTNLRHAEPKHPHGKKDHGNLPPESFKKYEKEKTIYDRKKEPGNLPPDSFKKFEKEKTIYDREDEPGNLPPESFEKYQDEDMNFKV